MPKQAMILAAGKGRRLGALSLRSPKPLLKINHTCLIEYHLYALAKAGVQRVIINVAYLGQKIIDTLGDGSRYGLHIIYSIEPPDAYQTGGGIMHALHHFNYQPFILLSADIWSNYDYSKLYLPKKSLAHCVLVDNPPYNPNGDMTLNQDGTILHGDHNLHTYANIAVIHPDLFNGCTKKSFPLSQPLFAAIAKQRVTAEIFTDAWFNIGTTKEINHLKKYFALQKVHQ